MVFSESSRLAYLPKLCVMLKILSSEVIADSDSIYMSVVKFYAYLDFEQNSSGCNRLSLWTINNGTIKAIGTDQSNNSFPFTFPFSPREYTHLFFGNETQRFNAVHCS